MDLVFVNHAHPSTPHVAGMRLWYFAKALAAKGHRIVLVCECQNGRDHCSSLDELKAKAVQHDWSMPLIVSVAPEADLLLRATRNPMTPILGRKAFIAVNYIFRGGVFWDFSSASRKFLPFFAREFRPEVVWGSFGNTDAWLIAQAIARAARCPWVADMKDPWDVFIPSGLRRRLASQFADMRAATCNSDLNANQFNKWFSVHPLLLYSGVDPIFFSRGELNDRTTFRLTLTGSVHDDKILEMFVDSLRSWLLDPEVVALLKDRPVEIFYAGADRERVLPKLSKLSTLCKVQCFGYLKIEDLARLCTTASVNSYIWNPHTFHHKLLELLSCGRPVIAFPGESDESRRLSNVCSGHLIACFTSDRLIESLTKIATHESINTTLPDLSNKLSWHAQSSDLEKLFHTLSS